MTTTLSLAEARASFSKIIDSATTTHERFTVTRNGVPAAVLLSAEDFESLLETLDILSSPEEMEAISQSQRDLAEGRSFTADEVRAELIAAGRLPRDA